MKVIININTRQVEVTMHNTASGVTVREVYEPMEAKLLGEMLVSNGNKLLEMERREYEG